MFIIFMNIEKKYRHTFYSFEGGKDVTISHFKSSEDERKILVLTKNRRHWKSIEGNVEEWVRESWERWMDEDPEWLDDNMKARIPVHMIPNMKDRQKVRVLQNVRRRSSLPGRAGEGRRLSLSGPHKVAPVSAIKVDKAIGDGDTIRYIKG